MLKLGVTAKTIFLLISAANILSLTSCSSDYYNTAPAPARNISATYIIQHGELDLPFRFSLAEGESVYITDIGVQIKFSSVILNYGDNNEHIFVTIEYDNGEVQIEYDTCDGVYLYYLENGLSYSVRFDHFYISGSTNFIYLIINEYGTL